MASSRNRRSSRATVGDRPRCPPRTRPQRSRAHQSYRGRVSDAAVVAVQADGVTGKHMGRVPARHRPAHCPADRQDPAPPPPTRPLRTPLYRSPRRWPSRRPWRPAQQDGGGDPHDFASGARRRSPPRIYPVQPGEGCARTETAPALERNVSSLERPTTRGVPEFSS